MSSPRRSPAPRQPRIVPAETTPRSGRRRQATSYGPGQDERSCDPQASVQPTVRAVTYCRISYDPTGQEAGVERQHVDTDRLADDRGWTIVERVVDNDRSASRYAKKAREGWTRVMDMVEAGQVDALVAYDLDRLTRQPKELERLIDAADRGLSVVTASGIIDLASAGGRMVARTLCNVAAHEADRVRDRMKAKLRHDAENGRPHWVRRPFGYQLDGTVIPAEAEWVRTMAKWIADDGLSATAVATKLNAAGVEQGSGKPWQSATVSLMLKSPRIIGMRTYHGKVVGKGTWEPLIDEDLWKRVCSTLNLRSQGMNTGRRSMLTGMVRCGVCGATMTRTNSKNTAAWRCTKHPDIGTGCGQQMSARHLEPVVVDMVMVRIGNVKPAPRKRSTAPDPSTVDRLRGELDDLAEMFGSGALTMGEWKAAREPLQLRLAAAEASLGAVSTNRALAELVGDTATLAERWETLDMDVRRRIIGLVLECVTIGAGQRGRLDLDRVEPTWRPLSA